MSVPLVIHGEVYLDQPRCTHKHTFVISHSVVMGGFIQTLHCIVCGINFLRMQVKYGPLS